MTGRWPTAVTVLVLVAGSASCTTGDGAASSAREHPSSTTTTVMEPLPPSTVAAPPDASVLQPPQPTAGPGGSAQPHRDVRVSSGGDGADAWFVFEPVSPVPESAPLAVVLHGYYEFEGYGTIEEFLLHTARGGAVVIYPRWQTDVADPCPGPYDIEPCMASARAGIEGAIEHLQSDPDRVQPQLDRASYFGFSFGGILTANLTNRHEELGLPEPAAIFLDDPHDGGMVAAGEPALDRPLDGIPATTLFTCHISEAGIVSEPGQAQSSCNTVFPLLDHLPDGNKALVMTRADDHGQPALTAPHGVCAAPSGQADAYDWNVCWRIWDALRSTAADGSDRGRALGGGPAHTDNGQWSDGTPIAPLDVATSAPIQP